MSYRCDICGKASVFGRQRSHKRGVAGKRWRKRAQVTLKIFKPNLHWASFTINGKKERLKLCTSCLKKTRKELKGRQALTLPSAN